MVFGFKGFFRRSKINDNAKELEKTLADKKVAYYSTVLNAWVQTNFEHNKHLLTLSSAGVGMLVSVLRIHSGDLTFYVYILSLLAFIVCILATLRVFSVNADYLSAILGKDKLEKIKKNNELKLLDKCADISFIFGVIFTVILTLLR